MTCNHRAAIFRFAALLVLMASPGWAHFPCGLPYQAGVQVLRCCGYWRS